MSVLIWGGGCRFSYLQSLVWQEANKTHDNVSIVILKITFINHHF